jgi:hypothetical protein
MSHNVEPLFQPDRLYSASDIGSRPCPVPALPGVYGFYFNEVPPGIDSKDSHRFGQNALLSR